ncbi:MAG: FAD-binding protein [Actinobacteria bacterium]|nr:FAD-binding protein [Actinomycetota bacterium]
MSGPALVVVEPGTGPGRGAELTAAARAGGHEQVVALSLSADPPAAAAADLDLVAAEPPTALDATAVAAFVDAAASAVGASSAFLPATETGTAAGAALAARRDGAFCEDVIALAVRDGALVATSGREEPLLADLALPADRFAVIAVRPGAFPPATGATAERQLAPPAAPTAAEAEDAGEVRLLESRPAAADAVAVAGVLFGIGRGVEGRDGIERVAALAAANGAAVCATRPHIATGWLGRDRLVGRSGATAAPRLYVAFGVSGASQHLVGLERCEALAAVNNDPEAAIFARADLGIVADLDDVLPVLERLLADPAS